MRVQDIHGLTFDQWFHVASLLVLILGVALPILLAAYRLFSMMRDFPPHRHASDEILYPKGYEPTDVEVGVKVNRGRGRRWYGRHPG